MKKISFSSIIFSLIFLFPKFSSGQGCSDAGFCTVSGFKPGSAFPQKTLNNQVKAGAFFGSADHNIAVYGAYLEYNRRAGEKLGIDIKLTSLAQNGNEISEFGLSDVFLTGNYFLNEKNTITLGVKIPLANGGRSLNNLPLPMDYQSSLGTFDLIFGFGYQLKKLFLAAALQQPLTQNDNQFLASSYPNTSELRNFQSTNQFKRSGDVLLRMAYPFALGKKLDLTLGILPIYHLQNDKYTDESNVEREIAGSKGLTLNGNIYLDYQVNEKNSIQLNMGMPFVVRESRPDGLTRGFIANLEYRVRF